MQRVTVPLNQYDDDDDDDAPTHSLLNCWPALRVSYAMVADIVPSVVRPVVISGKPCNEHGTYIGIGMANSVAAFRCSLYARGKRPLLSWLLASTVGGCWNSHAHAYSS